jgi:glycosyltransferase involved in cell wall biosynthesis
MQPQMNDPVMYSLVDREGESYRPMRPGHAGGRPRSLRRVRVSVGFDLTHARLNSTGLGRYPTELAAALRARPEVDLLGLSAVREPSDSMVGRVAQGLAREGLYYPAGLAHKARRAGAEILHTPTPAPVRGGGLPLVITVHDLLPLRLPQLFTLQTRTHTRLYLPFVRRATRVITPSEYTRGEVIELLGLPEERVVTVAEGCAERFAPRDVDREQLRRDYGIEGPYVLCVGTLEPRKNLVMAMRVFRRVSAALPDAELVVVGGRGWRNQAFERELGREGAAEHLRVTGFVSDARLVELYAGAACFLFPSLGEGFGLPPLEAMACGSPVVMSDRPALKEVAGGVALEASPLDEEGLSRHVIEVMQNEKLAADLSARGLARVRGFSWDGAAAATEGVYREALLGAD